MAFKWPLRVYIEDTDAGGIVYYANYFKFFERARSEWLRAAGFNQEVLRQQQILFVVREVSAKYRQPARLDDELEVSVSVEKIGKASFQLTQSVYRIEPGAQSERTELVQGRVSIACVSRDGKPRAMPEEIFQIMSQPDQELL